MVKGYFLFMIINLTFIQSLYAFNKAVYLPYSAEPLGPGIYTSPALFRQIQHLLTVLPIMNVAYQYYP